MDVTRRHDGFSELLSQLDDRPVHILYVFLRPYLRDPLAGNHKFIIAERLYLQIVIEVHDTRNPLLALIVQKRLVQLSCLAGAAHYEPLPVSGQLALGNPRLPAEVVQVGLGYERIQVHSANLILSQYDDMERRKLFNRVGIR